MKYSTTERAAHRPHPGTFAAVALAAALLIVFATGDRVVAAPDGPERVFALTQNDSLLRFDGDAPRDVVRERITGLPDGTSLVGIDFRPSAQPAGSPNQGDLYAVGDDGFIYKIAPGSGAASQGPQLRTDPANPATAVVPLGESFGVDFNPVVDRLRIVSDADQNLRVNVDTGATTVDGPLAYNATATPPDPNAGQNPAVSGAAYRNARAAAFDADPTTPDTGKTTQLFDVDSQTEDLALQSPPNNGTLNTVGELSRNAGAQSGFDIVTRGGSPEGDRAYAALQPNDTGSTFFYRVDLEVGGTSMIGRIGSKGTTVEGIAIPVNQR